MEELAENNRDDLWMTEAYTSLVYIILGHILLYKHLCTGET